MKALVGAGIGMYVTFHQKEDRRKNQGRDRWGRAQLIGIAEGLTSRQAEAAKRKGERDLQPRTVRELVTGKEQSRTLAKSYFKKIRRSEIES